MRGSVPKDKIHLSLVRKDTSHAQAACFANPGLEGHL